MRISQRREIAIKEINKDTIEFQKGISVFRDLKTEVTKEHRLHIKRIDTYIQSIERIIDERIDKIAKKHELNSTVLRKIINCTK